VTQDIVDKLRGMYPVGATPYGGFVVILWHYAADMKSWREETDLCKDAAAQIERLRKEVASLKAWPHVPGPMPDIVDRLWAMDSSNCCDSDHLFDGILVDAAQEISKLRDELRTYTDGSNDDVQREAV
jgi:hypothetical protein